MASEYYRIPDWETRLRTFAHAIGLVLGAFLLAQVTGALGVVGVRAAGVTVETVAALPPVPYAFLNAARFVGFFLAVLLYLQWRGFPDLFDVRVPSLRDLGLVVAGFVALFAVAYALTVAFDALGLERATNSVSEQGRQDPVRFLYLIPVTFLFVAPGEELLFRGVVQGLFRRAYGVVPAVAFASLLFAFGHWLALVGSSGGKLGTVAVIVALGAVLGTLYELTENLLVPVLVHACWNTMSFLTSYADATGFLAPPW